MIKASSSRLRTKIFQTKARPFSHGPIWGQSLSFLDAKLLLSQHLLPVHFPESSSLLTENSKDFTTRNGNVAINVIINRVRNVIVELRSVRILILPLLFPLAILFSRNPFLPQLRGHQEIIAQMFLQVGES